MLRMFKSVFMETRSPRIGTYLTTPFNQKGDLITVTPGRKHKYGVEISKNEYLEEDKSKRCRKYPNSEYASYMACDDQFVRDICEKEKLAPIWLLDDISQATVQALIKGTSGKYVFFL